MATWKKVVVSGSAISQLDNDANYVSATGLGILSSSAQIATDISGAFTEASGGFSTRIESLESSVGAGGLLSSSAQIATDISGAFTEDSGGFSTRITTLEGTGTIQGVGTQDSPTFENLTLTGDLTVQGDVTSIQTTNLNVEDQFILLNSGSMGAADGGLVIYDGGSSIGWDNSEGRFALDATGSTWDQTTITSDAFIAAVVTTDDANYRKNGNIRVESGDIFIYVE